MRRRGAGVICIVEKGEWGSAFRFWLGRGNVDGRSWGLSFCGGGF